MRLSYLFVILISFLVIRPASAYLYNQKFGPQAGILIEPVVGFSIGELITVDPNDPVDDYRDYTDVSYGGRLGFQYGGLQMGADYLKSTLSFEKEDWKDSTINEWAWFVGYKFPALLRLYAGYIFSATGEATYVGSKLNFIEGSGSKFGIGFTGFPFVNINLEYKKGVFGDVDVGGVKIGAEQSYHSYMLSFSVPIFI